MKPEHRFRQSISKFLRKKVYVWPINDNWQVGVPDHYYSGNKADLWAEYKFFPHNRSYFSLVKPIKRPKLTRAQQHWLNSRYDEGRNVWVVVGMPAGGVVLTDKQWMQKVITVNNILTRKEIAQAILKLCA